MQKVLTAMQMRAFEAVAIASGATTGLDLMERAGLGAVEAVLQAWPELASGTRRAVVLCGAGGNGGDGYVIARRLSELGWSVVVGQVSPPMSADAQEMAARWHGEVRAASALGAGDFDTADLCFDAIFGTGLGREVSGEVCAVLALASQARCRLVAVDIISGVCADSGRLWMAAEVIAAPVDMTVTFHCAKRGHFLDAGGFLAGPLRVVDLGLGDIPPSPRVAELVSLPARALSKRQGHKFSHGHALILAGGVGQGGAARLAARAALRIGAGLVTLVCPPEALAENAARLDAVMLRPVADAKALGQVLEDKRITALCLGPGLGIARAERLLPLALDRPVVLDADALTALAARADGFAGLHAACVLTPHAGEFARMFPDLAARLAEPMGQGLAFSKADAVCEAAARAGCVVLFKGADTVIAAPDGRCAISAAFNERAAPWLATAGAGDVLAGIITGLLARGFSAFDSACYGAWLHVEAARVFGAGLIAEDLPEALVPVLRRLEA
jgi:ADP-dependent NAD(P)H-hydrate dehydratase / NAD(P)H-hydrate epimerase